MAVQAVSRDRVPDNKHGRGKSKRQKLVDEEVQSAHDALDKLLTDSRRDGVDYSLMFEFTDNEAYKFTSPRMQSAKDRCRRAFRKALDELEFDHEPLGSDDDHLFIVTYEFDLDRVGSGEVMVRGWRSFVDAKMGDE